VSYLQISDAASKASDKAGSNIPDVNVPGFGPFKFNPKEDAKQAAKKSPLGFMNVGELAFDLPGSGVSKDDLPNNVKPGDAAGLPKGPTAKPPSLPNLPKVCTDMHGNCYLSSFFELGNNYASACAVHW